MKEMSVEELQQEVKKWKSKYQSQVSKMGAYKTKVQREVLDREKMVRWKEETLKEKEDFLKNTNIEINKDFHFDMDIKQIYFYQ